MIIEKQTVEKIITSMIKKPKITQKELIEITGLSRRGVEWNIKRLKEKNAIKRVGSDKGGKWVVLKE